MKYSYISANVWIIIKTHSQRNNMYSTWYISYPQFRNVVLQAWWYFHGKYRLIYFPPFTELIVRPKTTEVEFRGFLALVFLHIRFSCFPILQSMRSESNCGYSCHQGWFYVWISRWDDSTHTRRRWLATKWWKLSHRSKMRWWESFPNRRHFVSRRHHLYPCHLPVLGVRLVSRLDRKQEINIYIIEHQPFFVYKIVPLLKVRVQIPTPPTPLLPQYKSSSR